MTTITLILLLLVIIATALIWQAFREVKKPRNPRNHLYGERTAKELTAETLLRKAMQHPPGSSERFHAIYQYRKYRLHMRDHNNRRNKNATT